MDHQSCGKTVTQPHTTLESAISYEFSDKQLIQEALTHTSYANERRVGHNERLEFLGDSVLNAATTHLLFQEFPKKPEGQLSRLRARLECSLARLLALSLCGLHIGCI